MIELREKKRLIALNRPNSIVGKLFGKNLNEKREYFKGIGHS